MVWPRKISQCQKLRKKLKRFQFCALRLHSSIPGPKTDAPPCRGLHTLQLLAWNARLEGSLKASVWLMHRLQGPIRYICNIDRVAQETINYPCLSYDMPCQTGSGMPSQVQIELQISTNIARRADLVPWFCNSIALSHLSRLVTRTAHLAT